MTLYASLAGAFVVLLYVTRHQWFFYDEWDFIAVRGFAGRPLNLFTPHNEHWTTIPILVYRGLFDIFGARTYLPYMAVLFAAHIAVAYLLWRLVLRIGVNPWVATATTIAFLFLGGAYEDLTWAFQMTFIGSVAFGLLAVLLTDRDERAAWGRQVLVWGLLVAALMCSGIGIAMIVFAGVTALVRRGPPPAALTISVPAIVYIVWLLAVGHSGLTGTQFSSINVVELPQYIWQGLTTGLDAWTGFAGAGATIVLGIVVWLVWHRAEYRSHAVAFAGVVSAVLFFVLNGFARLGFGVSEATAPRYVYVTAAFLLPVIAWAISRLATRGLVVQLAVIAVVLFSAWNGLGTLWVQAHNLQAAKTQSKQQILAAADLLASGTRAIGDPEPVGANGVTAGEILALFRGGDLPASAGLSSTDRLTARAALNTSIATTAVFANHGVSLDGTTGVIATRDTGGCSELRATASLSSAFRLTFSEPASVQLESPDEGILQLYLQTGAGTTQLSNVIRLGLYPNTIEYLNEQLPDVSLFVLSPFADLRVCT